MAKHLQSKCRVFSFDFRGHGFNKQIEKDNLSKETLIKDTIRVIEYITEKEEFKEDPLVILGHSMGGSIANFAVEYIFKHKEYESLAKKIQALIVIDVVEGTAMEALPFMENIVLSRPKQFDRIEQFVEYMFKSNTIQNLESVRVSVPSLVVKDENDEKFKWKTNLLDSKKYWKEWFSGLTNAFLSVKLPKLLILAGSERMDKELTIAHMQGKFKMLVIYNVGHIVHEDNPKNTAIALEDFIHAFRIPTKLSLIKPIIGKFESKEINKINTTNNNTNN